MSKVQPVHAYSPLPMTSVVSLWPLYKWILDTIRSIQLVFSQNKFMLEAIDYFTKWIEAEALSGIWEEKVVNFIWKTIVCHFKWPK